MIFFKLILILVLHSVASPPYPAVASPRYPAPWRRDSETVTISTTITISTTRSPSYANGTCPLPHTESEYISPDLDISPPPSRDDPPNLSSVISSPNPDDPNTDDPPNLSFVISPPNPDDPDDNSPNSDDPDDICPVLIVQDVMDLKKQIIKKPAFKSLRAAMPTGVIVHELRLTMDGQVLKIHGIWIGTLKDDHMEHLKNQHRATQDQQRIVAVQEVKSFEVSYINHLKQFWYNENLESESFWMYESWSHSSYSRSIHMPNYIQTTATHGLRFVKGGEYDLMNILKELGHKFGDFIDGRKLVQDLRNRLGVNVFLIFKEKETLWQKKKRKRKGNLSLSF